MGDRVLSERKQRRPISTSQQESVIMAPGLILPAPDSPCSESSDPLAPPLTIDQLIRSRAASLGGDAPIVAYPIKGLDYREYSSQDLDIFAYRTAKHYVTKIPQRKSSAESEKVVAILGLSNLDYLVSTLALSRLGMTVLFLSTRISDAAYESLLQSTGCEDIVVQTPNFSAAAGRVKERLPHVNVHPMVQCSGYLGARSEKEANGSVYTGFDQNFDPEVENGRLCWIIHSSGSTGLPKPIRQTHAAALRNYKNNFDLRGFITLPLFHAHGLSSVFRAIDSEKIIHVYNAELPLTGGHVIECLRNFRPEIFYGVPYALKLLADTEEGLAELRKCRLVMFGGSSCPDVLGDKLVKNGVMLVSHYGTTETGQLMTSFRNPGDLDWNYLQVSANLAPYILWEPQAPGSNIHELVVMPGWPSKVATNRDDGGYATKDLFESHPTKSDRWKYFGRKDDTLVLVNGEKANPLPIEHTIRENQYVAECVVFGAGREQLGALIIPSAEYTRGMNEQDILKKIEPSIKAANSEAPDYAKLTPQMIRLLPVDVEYPLTDKGTIIRAAFYREFQSDIDGVYTDAESAAEGGLELDLDGTKEFVRNTMQDILCLDPLSMEDDTDFFALGMDSLQAIQAQQTIRKSLSTGGKPLGENIVFEKPSIDSLSRYLWCLRTEGTVEEEDYIQGMRTLIEEYSRFFPFRQKSRDETKHTVLLTGATGSLGAHILSQLIRRPDVQTVFCLVRASTPSAARQRIYKSLHSRRLLQTLTPRHRARIYPVPGDVTSSSFDDSSPDFSHITSIIHAAWAVNFTHPLSSFRPHLYGLSRLIALASYTGATMNFCSSVSSTASTPGSQVAESHESHLPCAQATGYARSKLVAENICFLAARTASIPARVLRLGQLIGDTANGIWNNTEAIPRMVQLAGSTGKLPQFALDTENQWLPVDTAASAILDLSLLLPHAAPLAAVWNVTNPTPTSWRTFVNALGRTFDIVSTQEWLKSVPLDHPLRSFWIGKHANEDDMPGKGGKIWTTAAAAALSPALRAATPPSETLVARFLMHWTQPKITTRIAFVAGEAEGTEENDGAVIVKALMEVGKSKSLRMGVRTGFRISKGCQGALERAGVEAVVLRVDGEENRQREWIVEKGEDLESIVDVFS
ncbi:aminoadipate-semialdehyde dehydrogenase large subunit [Geopyxis carbonaria]|nr:aminoadipate-semialdehyde dehydrogenase large subunit [Geopyxis carbonaria]